MNFNSIENIAGLSIGVLLILLFGRLIVWFVGELRGLVQESHTRENDSETKADLLQDKFAEEATARARLEVEVQFLKSSLSSALAREAGFMHEIETLKLHVEELRRRLDDRG